MLSKPEPLRVGDTVGIFLPASPVKKPFRNQGLLAMQAMGYQCRELAAVFSGHDFLSRSPEQSLVEIEDFFAAADIKALWAGRGGYGSNYLLPLLERLEIVTPKIVVASSDVSYLLWYLLERRRMVVFYGPMVYGALAAGRFDRESILTVLTGDYQQLLIPGDILCHGSANGLSHGGCLSNFASLLGTAQLPDVKESMLLLEDVNERPYRLDRLLWQCEQAGIFRRIRALLLGEFPGCFRDDAEKEFFFRRWQLRLADLHIPVLFNMPFGHARAAHVLPLGIEVEIDTRSFAGLMIREKGVQP